MDRITEVLARLRHAIDLMEQSKQTFKSKRIAAARAEVERALEIITETEQLKDAWKFVAEQNLFKTK